MKTILITGYDHSMRPIGDLTVGRMQRYAQRHNIAFSVGILTSVKPESYWAKVPATIEMLKDFDRVIWLDADQMITEPDAKPWENMTTGFHASKDWGVDATDDSHFSMCGFVMCRDAIELFLWLEENKADWISKPFPEQAPMRWLYEHRGIFSSGLGLTEMTTHARHVFNAVPRQVHESVVDAWTPLDWCAHITMVPTERRVEIFHEITRMLNETKADIHTGCMEPTNGH